MRRTAACQRAFASVFEALPSVEAAEASVRVGAAGTREDERAYSAGGGGRLRTLKPAASSAAWSLGATKR